MYLNCEMLGDAFEPAKAVMRRNRIKVTAKNLRRLRQNGIAVERDIGLYYFKGEALIRFVRRIDQANWRMISDIWSDKSCRRHQRFENEMINAFIEGAAVYDEAVKAYLKAEKKSGSLEAIRAERHAWNKKRSGAR